MASMTTIGEITQTMLNDPSGQFFTDALVLAALNRVNRELSRKTRYLGIVTGTITTNGTSYTFALPGDAASPTIYNLFDLTEDPIYDATTPITRTTEAYLSRIDSLWRTKTTASAPTHCVLNKLGGYVTFYPGPTTNAKAITCCGHGVAIALAGAGVPVLPEEFQPILAYGAAIDLLSMVGESGSIEKMNLLKPKYNEYLRMLTSEVGNSETPRWIRGVYGADMETGVDLGLATSA